ncbi:MAG: alpha/beta fold hydrolase [Burkholderiales bacterium]|nr:alpha/beta fold hydrolase [Burkholderiales bacterium]
MNTELLPQQALPALAAHRQGYGETVLCLHSSTGSQAQWRTLANQLAGRCRMIAPDFFGHGHSPAWPTAQANTLAVDAHGASTLVPGARAFPALRGVHLVGHSYGAAVALQLALRHPRWVRSLTLYEPVAFGVIDAMAPEDDAFAEIEDIAHAVQTLVRRGESRDAARVFVGYWAGAGAWDAMGTAAQAVVLSRIATVPRHFEALFHARWNPRLLGALTMPVLLMQGADTRASARCVCELLGEALPNVRRVEFPGAGHLGPLTQAAGVASVITTQLDAQGALRPMPHTEAALAA